VFRYAWFMPKVPMPNLHRVDLLVEGGAAEHSSVVITGKTGPGRVYSIGYPCGMC